MKIGEIIAKIGELIAAVENSESNEPSNPAQADPRLRNNTAGMAPVIIQAGNDKPSPNGTTAAGNDKEPEELFLPPLQQKQELLKKAVGVENIYDDGRPGEEGDENADAPTPEEEDMLEKIKRMAGVPIAAIQELSNDEVFDD
jgi:hypothetical protein